MDTLRELLRRDGAKYELIQISDGRWVALRVSDEITLECTGGSMDACCTVVTARLRRKYHE